jgi:replication initiator protein RepSA
MGSDGFDRKSLPTWVRQIAEKAAQPGSERWRQMVEGVGGCTAPIRLVGDSATIDANTREVLATYSTRDEPTEYLLVACGNRRASRCEPCARVYADDTFHLIRSGLVGGRNVPASVAAHPVVFATFTAPSSARYTAGSLTRAAPSGRAIPGVRDLRVQRATPRAIRYWDTHSIWSVTTTPVQCSGTIARERSGTCSRSTCGGT